MKTITHTKRSEEFQQLINALIRELSIINDMSDASRLVLARQITEVLRNNTTDSGCLVNAAADEPIFVLRGKDVTALVALKEWVNEALRTGRHIDKVDTADLCIGQFRMYQHKQQQEIK